MDTITTHFFEQIKKGKLEIIQAQFAQHPSLIETKDQQKRTPLLVAAMHQHYEIASYFYKCRC